MNHIDGSFYCSIVLLNNTWNCLEECLSVRQMHCAAGAILTKMDGDSRGGAALSVKAVSGKPIKFVGTGEKLEALEPFYPDRIASRILGDFFSAMSLRMHIPVQAVSL